MSLSLNRAPLNHLKPAPRLILLMTGRLLCSRVTRPPLKRSIYPIPGRLLRHRKEKSPILALKNQIIGLSSVPRVSLSIVPKILEQATPQTGVTSLVLRIELNFQSKGESHKSIVSAAQVWVNNGGQWRIFVTQRSDVQASVTVRLPEPARPDTRLYPEPTDAHKDIDAALSAAQSDHKRVLVIFGGNWCYDCHVLDTAMRSDQLATLVAANYHVVHINVADGKANTDLGERFQVPFDKGFPALAVIDGSGQLITSQKQGEFESAEKIGMDDVSAFLNRWKPIFSDKPTR